MSQAQAPVSGNMFLKVFPSIMLPMFLAIVDGTIVAMALPDIAASLGSPERVAWIVIAYLIAATIAAPIYGTLGDVFGRRRMMLVALAVFVAAALLCAAASSVEMLAAARLIQGLGGGGLATSSHALIGETVPARQRGKYQGYLATVVVVSSTVGPVAGGILTEQFGWRSVFLASVPISLVAVILALRLPDRAGSRSTWQLDAPGLCLFILCVSSLLVALEEVRKSVDLLDPGALSLLILALVSGVSLLAWEKRAAAPLLPLKLLRHPAIWPSNALAAFHGATVTSLVAILPIYLRVVLRLSAQESGLLLLPLTIGIGIGSLAAGRIVTRTGYTALLPSLSLIVATAALAAMALTANSLDPTELLVLLAAVGLFLGPTMPVVQLTVQVAAGPASLGVAAGFVQFSRSIGAAFGTALCSAVLFGVVALWGPQVGEVFGQFVATGPSALADLSPKLVVAAHEATSAAFRAVFALLAAMAAAGMAMAWFIPARRV